MGENRSAGGAEYRSGALYAAAHFWVDLSCAYLILRFCAELPGFAGCILLYNFCAFAGQMPLGMLADSWNRNGLTAAMGCVLVAGALLALAAFSALSGQTAGGTFGQAAGIVSMTAAVTAGTGNALFHIGGGLEAMNAGGEKASALGVFVAPGAVGLYIGRKLSGSAFPATVLVAAGLFLLAAGIWTGSRKRYGAGMRTGNSGFDLKTEAGWLPFVPLFLVVVLRSYMGMYQDFPWKGNGVWGVVLVLALALGKAAGGFLMDRLGPGRASVLSLGLAAACYLGSGIPVVGVCAVFLFNMTMPVTLWAASRQMTGAKGFTFGLLTFALFIGFVPYYLGYGSLLSNPASYAGAAALSMILLMAAFQLRTGSWRG